MDMSVGRFAEAGEERRSRVQGAVIAGSVAGACLIAVPAGLLELAFASIGLSEFVPVLAPPVGWPVRIVLALVGAVVAALLSGGSGGTHGDGMNDRRPGRKRNAIMGWTQSLGLHHLARLARGQAAEADPRITITPEMRAPRARRSPQEKVQDTLARHRADLHPDAPPRAPLMASRDLPAVTELTVVETSAESAPAPEPRAPLATPIRDTTDQVRPRPLPRSPEPFSDSDLDWIRGLLASRDEAAGTLAREPGEPLSSCLPETAGVEVSADDSLMSMLDRFENGVDHRIALRDAADAQNRIEDSIASPLAPVPASPAPTVKLVSQPLAEPVKNAEAEQPAMDMALSAALDTLKALSAKANGR